MADKELQKREGSPRTRPSEYVPALVVAALAIWFAVVNFQDVEVTFFFTTVNAPLIIVIAVSVLLGVALGYLVARRRRKGKGES